MILTSLEILHFSVEFQWVKVKIVYLKFNGGLAAIIKRSLKNAIAFAQTPAIMRVNSALNCNKLNPDKCQRRDTTNEIMWRYITRGFTWNRGTEKFKARLSVNYIKMDPYSQLCFKTSVDLLDIQKVTHRA